MSVLIRPCSGCARPTRPFHAKLADYPGSVCRFRGSECKVCYTLRPSGPADEYTHAGLRSFIRRRNARLQAMVRRDQLETFLTQRISA